MPRRQRVYGADSRTCVFCEIVSGDHHTHVVCEDERHLAFLSRYPNTEGVTVVMTKKHFPSYIVDVPDDELASLLLASKGVARLLDSTLPDVSRTGLAFEGLGINHIHAKLFPFHGTGDMDRWRPVESEIDTFFAKYEGYFCTNDGPRADEQELAALAFTDPGNSRSPLSRSPVAATRLPSEPTADPTEDRVRMYLSEPP